MEKENLTILHQFGQEIVDMLNESSVRKPDGVDIAALMVIIGIDEQTMPIGGSINFNEQRDRWEMMTEVDEAQPYHDTN